jgi:hypothetical protein
MLYLLTFYLRLNKAFCSVNMADICLMHFIFTKSIFFIALAAERVAAAANP